jgi:anti-sigma B factor antagonist
MDIDVRAAAARPQSLPEIVAFPAEIDISNAERIGAELREATGHGATVVIADMTRTTFCDSSGIRVLLAASDRAAEAGATLRIALDSYAVLRVLRTTGADKLLRIYASLQAALTNPPESG